MIQDEQEPKSKAGNISAVAILSVGLMGAATLLAYNQDRTFGLFFGLIGFGTIAGLHIWRRRNASKGRGER